MKIKITLITLSLILSNLLCAQSEPEAIKTKDLIDKIDRSEISTGESNPTLENIMPDFEMPKIEFNENKKKNSKSKIDESSKTKEPVNSVDTSKKVSKPTTVKNRVLISKRPISLSQLLQNDKIVISNGQTFVYRLNDNTITQYKIKNKIPLKSLGLKANGKNGFYIVDIVLLKKDAKALRKNTKNTKSNKTKKPKNTVTKTIKPKPASPINKSDPLKKESKEISPDILTKRKALEKKFNRGRSIKSTVTLRTLQTNDEIIISGGVQLVLRKKKSTSGVKKYWLVEKLDVNNSSVIEKSKNIYKLIQSYK